MNRCRPLLVLALVAVIAAGCGDPEEAADEMSPEEPSGEAFEGLSPEEIRRQAESMSPAVAESLGIVDTTIHVEERIADDTITIPPPQSDTSR